MRGKRYNAVLRTLVCSACALLVSLATAQSTGSVDYVELFRTKVLSCVHPTVQPEKATIKVQKDSVHSGDTSTTRMAAFYPGLIKKNAMQVDVIVRESGSIRQMRINVPSDTSALQANCPLANNWVDF